MLWVRAMDITRPSKRKIEKKQFLMWKNQGSVGADLDHLEAERAITTDPNDNRKRRTLQLFKQNGSWGFTLQTYGVRHKKTQEIDIMTYVDYVDIHGSAYIAGLRKGDVIISVNGKGVELATHQELVNKIKSCGESMRLVVLFEDCCKKVELYDRMIKLKEVLSYKVDELRTLEMQEREIMNGICAARGLNREDVFRQSIYSKASLNSWDDISLISSPQMLRNQTKSWATNSGSSDNFTLKSSNEGEDNSIEDSLNFDDSYIDITYADSDSDSGACMNDSVFELNQSKNKIDDNSEKEQLELNKKVNVMENTSELIDNKSINSLNLYELELKDARTGERLSLQSYINSCPENSEINDLIKQNIETNSSDTDLVINTSDTDSGKHSSDTDLGKHTSDTDLGKHTIDTDVGKRLSDTDVVSDDDTSSKISEQDNMYNEDVISFLSHNQVYINTTNEHTKL